MRSESISGNKDFQVKAIAGTRTILMALNCPDARRAVLRGFSFYRKKEGDAAGKWLLSQKVFKSVIPNPKLAIDGAPPVFTTQEFPVQSFLWGDYTPEPGSTYDFQIFPMYGEPGALKTAKKDAISISIRTEDEYDANGHSVWFNRGAIASQHFAKKFGNIKPTDAQLEDVNDPVTKWLSRGLLEACLQFITDVEAGETLYCCAYEFTYQPVLRCLKDAIARGVHVNICFHDTKENAKAIETARLPAKARRKTVLFPRTVPKIPDNKFFVRQSATGPLSVFTGSTNFTSSGFLGQSNVGHQINDPDVAASYKAYWEVLAQDPALPDVRAAVADMSPHPPEVPEENSTTLVFSPRFRKSMLAWYANRMLDATRTVMFTAAFGVSEEFVLPLAQDRDFLRFVLMEKRPTVKLQDQLRGDRDLVLAYGAALGTVTTYENKKRKVRKIQKFGLDEWFEEEEHYRKAGNIFYVHTKFLLIDAMTDDPLICTGSANFSTNSLTANDENMLIIRGNRRVADIYMTEFDRIFRHFYFRDVANEIALKGGAAEGAFLDEHDMGPDHWTNAYFNEGALKTRRREMFFSADETTWADNAATRPVDETGAGADKPKRVTRPK